MPTLNQDINSMHSYRESMIKLDSHGYLLSVNSQAKKLFGLIDNWENDMLHIDDLSIKPIIANESYIPEETILWDLIQDPHREKIFQAVLLKDNTEIWLDIKVKDFLDDIYISIFDITDLVIRFKSLKKSESHLQTLVSSLDDIIFEVSKDGTFINCWTNNEAHLFYSRDEFIGKPISEIIKQKNLVNEIYKCMNQVFIDGNAKSIDFKTPDHLQKDNWYKLQVKPVISNQESLIFIVSDITKAKKLELEQKIQEKKFNQAFNYSGIGMVIVKLNGEYIDVNLVLLQMLGLDNESIKSYNFIENTHPDDLEITIANREKLLKGELKYYTIEKRYRHADGHYIWCSSTMSMVHDTEGKELFLINQLIDITESKNNLTILQSQKSELEAIKIDLESKIKQLEEFNQIVSHNLRGPASNIRMLTDSIIENFSHYEDPTLKLYIEYLKSSSDNLIDTLQDLSSIIEVQSPNSLKYERCNFAQILNKIIDQFSIEIMSCKAIITMDLQIEHIDYPRIYLTSIIYNLLSNAIKYRVQGRIPEIHISTKLIDDKISLQIKDNGIGIDISKHKNKIFAFRHIFHTGFDSTGVGLFLTRYQVETLGGKIFVESTPNIGSTFTVIF